MLGKDGEGFVNVGVNREESVLARRLIDLSFFLA